MARIILRKIKTSDKKYFAGWWRDKELIKLTSGFLKPVSDAQVEKYFLEILKNTDSFHFIIFLGKKPIGHISLMKRKNNFYETQIIIGEKEYWGKGYGTQAIKILLVKAKKIGITKIYLEVRPDNVRAIRAYEKSGFKKVRNKKYRNKYLSQTLIMELSADKKMDYPKVKFGKTSIGNEENLLYYFLIFDKWGWEKQIIGKHPRLKEIYEIKGEKRRRVFLKKYILDFKKENQIEISRQTEKYKRAWGKAEKNYFKTLTEVLETSWPDRQKEIKALISINPICPRFLNTWSFGLYYGQSVSWAIQMIMHETCHFLYFKKWAEVFPGAEKKTFDHPHIEWHLSEILAPVILNDQRIQKILKNKAGFYNVHSKLKIGKISVPEYFTVIWRNHLKKKTSFGEFLEEAYIKIKENKKVFEVLK